MKNIGALWIKKSKKDQKEYFKGRVNDIFIVVFKNEEKRGEKSPDYRIFLSEKEGEKK